MGRLSVERSPGAVQAVQPVLRAPRTWGAVQLYVVSLGPSHASGATYV